MPFFFRAEINQRNYSPVKHEYCWSSSVLRGFNNIIKMLYYIKYSSVCIFFNELTSNFGDYYKMWIKKTEGQHTYTHTFIYVYTYLAFIILIQLLTDFNELKNKFHILICFTDILFVLGQCHMHRPFGYTYQIVYWVPGPNLQVFFPRKLWIFPSCEIGYFSDATFIIIITFFCI